ncbi:T9SS type A sorting domain-containing protein [Porphyromonas gulae]|uniref:T9SS type A sorting domain-containing protein n=1 Tax=Porphyromonas gulae TaxID=111105 RepID=UPI0018B0D2CB|nr:T9SS type A sorting domain-containing protein [Porphyromonas gulae]
MRTWFNGNKSELVVSVRVDKSGQYRSNLYNLSGQTVKTVTKTLVSGTTVYSMDIHDLPQGTYILRIEGNDRTLTTKVLK